MTAPGKHEITLMAVGDISLHTRDDSPPFEKMTGVLTRKDVLFGNLETVLSVNGVPAQKAVTISCDPERARFLLDAGFDVVNIANNHILDRGLDGLQDMLEVLGRYRLNFIGAGKRAHDSEPLIMEKEGVSLGFLGFTEYGFANSSSSVFVNKISALEMTNEICRLRSRCDAIIVSLHWGIENVNYPSPRQISLARGLIDAGATIVLGHHPHVIQAIERYQSGLIAYSLGNFQFGLPGPIEENMKSRDSRESIILSIKLGKDGLISYEIVPITINDAFVPEPASEDMAERISRRVSAVSAVVAGGEITSTKWYSEISETYLSGSLASWKKRIGEYGFSHFVQFSRWLVSPFVLRCCLAAMIRRFLPLAVSGSLLSGAQGREKAPAGRKI